MDDIIKRFTLDLQKNSSSEVVYASKSDIGRTIHVSIVNNGMPLYFTDSTTAMLSAKKDNEPAILEQCTICGNMVRYEISANITEDPCEIPCEIILYGAGGHRITTPAFTISVSDTNYADGDPVADPVEPTVVLMSPGNAKVGQYFQISEVGEDGRAVKLIPSDGTAGKSAYEFAVEGGYTGTEEEFASDLNQATAATEVMDYHLTEISPRTIYNNLYSGKKFCIEADFMDTTVIFSHFIDLIGSERVGSFFVSDAAVLYMAMGSKNDTGFNFQTFRIPLATKVYVDEAIAEQSQQSGEVCVDIPTATGVEPYYLALNDSNGLTVTQDAKQATDVYCEAAAGGFYIYTLIGNEKMYFNLITDTEPCREQLQPTPVTVYGFLEGIVCHRMGEDAVAIFIYDGALGFHPTEPSHYRKHSCDFISKDTNEVVSSPEVDTPYRFGILYGYPEADIKLTGDVRENGEYVLAVSNTANDEPVIVSGVANPERDTDAANKGFVVKAIANVNAGGGTGTGVQGPQGEPGRNGQDGKSAYEYAVEGGYTGTEEEFAGKMAEEYLPLSGGTIKGLLKLENGLQLSGDGNIIWIYRTGTNCINLRDDDTGAPISISGIAYPMFVTDVANKGYVDDKFVTLTQAEYDALDAPDPNTYYFIKGDS